MLEDDYENIPAAQYAEDSPYMQQIQAALQEASGSQARALKAQMDNARAARENAMEIAQLQASTSRYGVDVASKDRMRALKENARQFDASHGLEIAKAYTAFSSTPDLMFARNDFLQGMGRVGQGLNVQPYHSQGTPQAKTWQDFAAIAQYNGSTVPGGGQSPGGGGNGAQQAAAAAGGGGEAKAPPDPRVQAATSIMKALPPSDSPGADGQDWHAINAITEMFKAGRPGSLERLGESGQKIALAGAARAGYDPLRLMEDYKRSLPGQKSPLLSA